MSITAKRLRQVADELEAVEQQVLESRKSISAANTPVAECEQSCAPGPIVLVDAQDLANHVFSHPHGPVREYRSTKALRAVVIPRDYTSQPGITEIFAGDYLVEFEALGGAEKVWVPINRERFEKDYAPEGIERRVGDADVPFGHKVAVYNPDEHTCYLVPNGTPLNKMAQKAMDALAEIGNILIQHGIIEKSN